MDSYMYQCRYCGKDYKPNRRKVQKYCSNSCRTNAFNLRSKSSSVQKYENNRRENKPQEVEKMSWAGVGNAAAGSLAVNLATNLFTREENKPATKKDIKEIQNLMMRRYHKINNMQNSINGNTPYYDIKTQSIVYLKNENHGSKNR